MDLMTIAFEVSWRLNLADQAFCKKRENTAMVRVLSKIIIIRVSGLIRTPSISDVQNKDLQIS